MSGVLAFGVEILVALLLAATTAWCVILDRRLKQLRADDQVMRRTIAELAQATDHAERAIAALKATVSHADASLGARLESAERFAADLSINVRAGEDIIDRVRQIVETSRRAAAAQAGEPRPAEPPAPRPAELAAQPVVNTRLAATAIAAERLVERARARQRGLAA